MGVQMARPAVRAWAFDIGLAAAVAAVDFYGAYDEAHNPVQGDPTLKLPVVPPWAYLLVIGAGLALAARRRWPLPSFATVLALTVAFTVLGYDDGAPLLAVAVSLYTLALLVPARTTWTCLLVSVVLFEVTSAAFGPFGLTEGPGGIIPWELGAGVVAGFAISSRRAYVVQIKERAELAERTKEEEARRRVDAERLRIARELHDVVAHSMATVNVQAGVALHLLREQPGQLENAMEAIEAVRSTSKDALREMRGILDLLRSPDDTDSTAPVARLSQLDDLVSSSTRAGLPTAVTVTGQPRELPPAVDLAAYRVVQESLTNALRHAGPARAGVKLTYGPDRLIVEVSDDGRGAAPAGEGVHGNGATDGGTGSAGTGSAGAGSAGNGNGGNGLRGMRERAEAVGGSLEAGPGRDGGFVVRAVLPFSATSEPRSPGPVTLG